MKKYLLALKNKDSVKRPGFAGCVQNSFVVTFQRQRSWKKELYIFFMAAYNLLLSSSYDECRKLQDFLDVMADREGFSKAFLHELEFVVKEAFVNAVKHGNCEDKTAVVNLRFEHVSENGGQALFVEVADSGSGFAVHEIDNPTTPSLLMKSSGRGVFLMRAFAEIMGQESDEDGWRLRLKMRPF